MQLLCQIPKNHSPPHSTSRNVIPILIKHRQVKQNEQAMVGPKVRFLVFVNQFIYQPDQKNALGVGLVPGKTIPSLFSMRYPETILDFR